MIARPPRRPAFLACIALAALAGLSACADEAGYPSLAPRAVERGDAPADTAAPAPAVPAVPVDAVLDARVAALVTQATAGDADFTRTATEACRAVVRARGAADGSEAWIALQQMLSALDAARAPVLAAAAELDRLIIERGTAVGTAIDLSRLAEAQTQVSALDQAEQARVADIAARRCGG